MNPKELNRCVFSLLKHASEIIEVRAADYDSPCENSFPAIAELWNARAGEPLYKPSDVAEMLGLMKIGRNRSRNLHMDNFVDACAYFAFAYALRLEEEAEGAVDENS